MIHRLLEGAHALEHTLLTKQLARYGVAVSRILAGTAYTGILVTNFPQRHILFGAGSDWIRTYRDPHPAGAWVGLLDNVPPTVFTVIYLSLVVAAVCFALGWRAKLTGLLLLVGAYQIIEMNPLVGDQGDNVLRIGVLLLLFTDCAGVWSLDANRRTRATGASHGKPSVWRRHQKRQMPHVLATVVHNAAVIALAAQLVIIYVAAGMYKLHGDGWRYGTAISYPLSLDEYRVFPFLNDLITSLWPLVFLATYGSVFLQLYFPVLLLHPVTRRVALVGVLLLHLGIAVLMGLPWFSLAMVAFDGIFVSTVTYRRVEQLIASRRQRASGMLRTRQTRSTASTELVDEQV